MYSPALLVRGRQNCSCEKGKIRALISHRLWNLGLHIQIYEKNFAWNIAFQYNIGGDVTTSFVMATFAEWFTNSTFDTVRKNLRTTTGRHKIEIDENILSKYGI